MSLTNWVISIISCYLKSMITIIVCYFKIKIAELYYNIQRSMLDKQPN